MNIPSLRGRIKPIDIRRDLCFCLADFEQDVFSPRKIMLWVKALIDLRNGGGVQAKSP